MEKKIAHQGQTICYKISGSGPALLFVHGFGEDSTIWDLPSAYLKKDYQLIIPDLPGSGKSDLVPDCSMEALAEILLFIIQEEGIKKIHLIGHSMGGYISLAFAEKYSAFLTSFGLFHSSAFADTEEKKETRRKGISFIEQHGATEFLKTTIPNLFSPDSKSATPEIVRNFIARLPDFSDKSLVSYYQAMINRPDRTAVLKNLKVPVLFIAGKFDPAVPFSDSLRQAHLPENCYFHVLKKSGHMGMLEETPVVNRILETFLQQN